MARNMQPIVKRCRALGISPAVMGYTGNSKRESNRNPGPQRRSISKQYLSLIVRNKMRVPISTVISSMRTEVAARMLRDPEKTIQQIAEELTFSDQSSFGKFFKKHTGTSPLKYRQNLKKTLLTLRPKEVLDKQVQELV